MNFILRSQHGECGVTFDPADAEFAKRFCAAVVGADMIDRERKQSETTLDASQFFDLHCETDRKIRGLIDGLFDAPVCQQVFGDYHAFALTVPNNTPLWCNLLESVSKQFVTPLSSSCKRVFERWMKAR